MIVYAQLEILLVAFMASPLVICALRKRVRGLRLAASGLVMIYVVFAAKYFCFPIWFDQGALSNSGLDPNAPTCRTGAAYGDGNLFVSIVWEYFIICSFDIFVRGGVPTVPALRAELAVSTRLLTGD